MVRASALAVILFVNSAFSQEAMSWDRPIRVLNDKDQVRWSSDGGTCLTPQAWTKVDDEYKRLQGVEFQHKNEPSPVGWFVAGAVTGALVGLGAGLAIYLATR